MREKLGAVPRQEEELNAIDDGIRRISEVRRIKEDSRAAINNPAEIDQRNHNQSDESILKKVRELIKRM